MASSSGVDIESSYTALSALEDVIAILRRVSAFATLFPNCFPMVLFGAVEGKLMNSSEFLLLCLQDASIDPSEVFNRVVSSVCILLTRDEVILCFFFFIFYKHMHRP